jgi:N-acetylglucosamine-6-phosphate deacetylase
VIAGALAVRGRAVDGWVRVDGETIAEVGRGRPPGRATVRHDGIVAAGLVDLQVNGAGGRNVYDGPRALDRIDAVQLAAGVTSYLPTVISTDDETAARAIADIGARVADPASPVAGVHLEGPFLNEDFRGVHRAACLRAPSDGVPGYYDDPAVRVVTLAPELPGALDLVGVLAQRRRPRVTVSLGHSAASAEIAGAAADRGAQAVTHLFNAMSPLHHREPGLPGWALVDSRVRLGVIADGMHVTPGVLELIARAAGDRVVLVSDASPAAGARAGRYEMAGVEIVRDSSGRVATPDETLGGSSLTLDHAVRNWSRWTDTPLARALVAATDRPARLIGLPHGLRAGGPADLVLLSVDGQVQRTMKSGAWV